MEKGWARQFWLTVNTEGAFAGEYRGEVAVSAVDIAPRRVPIVVEIVEAEAPAKERPFVGVWGGWTRAGSPVVPVRIFGRLGLQGFLWPLSSDEDGALLWGAPERLLLEAAEENGVELVLAPPKEVFETEKRRERASESLAAARGEPGNRPFSVLMPARPFGSGLHPAYRALKLRSGDMRLGCEIDVLDETLKYSDNVVDDWYFSDGYGGDTWAESAFGQLIGDPEWQTFLKTLAPSDRPIVMRTARSALGAGEAARRLRALFWSAWRHGFEGVTLRPAGRSSQTPHDFGRPVWLDIPAGGEAAPRVSRSLQALTDGARDYALLRWYAEQIDELKARGRLKRKERKRLERMAKALDAVSAMIGDETPDSGFFDKARDRLYDGLLTEKELKQRNQDR
jgi:hypothetical protein